MKMIIEEIDSYVEGIKITYTPTEALVLNHAMQLFADNAEVHELDKGIMEQMLKNFAEGIDQGCKVMKERS